jgi:ribosome recycling factor
MIEQTIKDSQERMEKSLHSLEIAFNKIRTGRAHPSLLDSVMVSYYGSDTPLSQLANITVEEGRLLVIVPWERKLITDVEKAIHKSDLGLNPSNNGESIRLPMPSLTEETRREYTKQAKNEAEGARVAIRNIRRDANAQLKDLLKNKEISEDDQRRAEERIQKLTDKFIASVDVAFGVKEKDLLSI